MPPSIAAEQVGRPSPGAVRLLRSVVRPLVSLAFRPSIEGLEHLPRDRPFLLVANHSAGVSLAELASFAALYVERVGPDRPLAGFAHPMGFRVWPLTAIHRALGSVPSTYEAAHRALAQGVPILVFPGGDHEALRPISQAHRVDLGGRKGFLRIARDAQVPIVPMGIRGSHLTAPILLRSKALANLLVMPRVIGTKRWGLSVLGLAGAAAIAATPLPLAARAPAIWAWLGSPLVFLPIVPATIGFRIGPPIEPDALFGPDDRELDAALTRITHELQSLVDAQR